MRIRLIERPDLRILQLPSAHHISMHLAWATTAMAREIHGNALAYSAGSLPDVDRLR